MIMVKNFYTFFSVCTGEMFTRAMWFASYFSFVIVEKKLKIVCSLFKFFFFTDCKESKTMIQETECLANQGMSVIVFSNR